MKKLIIEGKTFTLKKKTILEPIISKEDALEYFEVFLKEYLGEAEYGISMDKSEFLDLILSHYSISNESSFTRLSNAYVKRRGTLVGYMLGVLCQLDYKATDLIKLTQSELFDIFTLAVHNTVCVKNPEIAYSISDDLERFGISKNTASVYIQNGIPENSAGGKVEKTEPRVTTEEEDIKQLFKDLQ
ncbi:MAG: hypothetical protein ACRCX2_05300 [Paraclostridium sp.]